jgi:hypothetical protein
MTVRRWPRMSKGRREMSRLIVLAAAVAGLLVATTAAGASPYFSLDGELMTGTPQVTSNCNPSGNSTISYTVSGFATGTYPGTFTETGVATIGPQPSPGVLAVPITSFSATFVIEAGPFRITGIKTLANPTVYATDLGFCFGALQAFGAEATWDARVSTPTGTFADSGRTNVAVDLWANPQFIEQLHSDFFELQPAPLVSAKVTGGGTVGTTGASTGFVVERRDSSTAPRGQWEYVNKDTRDIVHSTAISDVVVIGNTAIFSGTCRNEALPSGSPCSFTVVVQDNGNGGSGTPDTVSISGVGFTGASGPLSGNLAIH